MPHFNTIRRVPFTPRQMFAVVADIERYPEFLPLVEGLTVLERKESGETTELTAAMTVGYNAITERFTTRVVLAPKAGEIQVRHLEGPFSHLENDWRFVAADGGCDVHFTIDYAFRSTMLSLIVGGAFERAVKSYTDAFEARARALYGPPAAA